MEQTQTPSEEEVLILYYMWKKKYKKPTRNVWVRELYLHRDQESEFFLTYPKLLRDPVKFQNYYRMSLETFEKLTALLKPHFKVGHTNCRKTISFLERVSITIRYLANGESFASSSYRFKISPQEVSRIIIGMLELIAKALQDIYFKKPNKQLWNEIADGFCRKKYFPHCIGAVDGKHVRIKKPRNAGSLYYNYKQFHSVVLLTVVDANYKFVIVDIGAMGKNSDAGIFDNSKFGEAFKNGTLDLPDPISLEDGGCKIPFVFVGDEAFRLTENFMKPYPRRQLDRQKRIFNYRLSYARGIVECAFGILVSKFRIFESPINLEPGKVDKVILAATLLHNMIRQEDRIQPANEEPESLPNSLGAFELSNQNKPKKGGMNQSTKKAREVRDYFCEYFNNSGKVPWQDSKIIPSSDSDGDDE